MLKAGQARLSVTAWISDPRFSVSHEMQTPAEMPGFCLQNLAPNAKINCRHRLKGEKYFERRNHAVDRF
jgi:hypothetical protein